MANLQNLENSIEDIKSEISDLKKIISGLQIDLQNTVTKNKNLVPGIGTKIGYDSNGLVVSTMELAAGDLPMIPMNKVNGLTDKLDSFITSTQLSDKLSELSDMKLTKSNIVGTGIKVNYDENGLVVSSSDELLVEDIPQLAIDKIDGLSERLSAIESLVNENDDSNDTSSKLFNAGEYTKVSIDENGNITKGSKLSITDIPNDIITRLNQLELAIGNCVNQQVVTTLTGKIGKKLDSNNPIESGTYSKVVVDKNGLVTNGTQLEYSDLPNELLISIDDIKSRLDNMMESDYFVETINTINENFSTLTSGIKQLNEQMSTKATNEDLSSYKMDLIHLNELVNNLNGTIANDTIMDELNKITKSLSDITGRISVIENKLDIS